MCTFYSHSRGIIWPLLFLDIYVDGGKKSYAALDFKQMSFTELFSAILSAAARAAQTRAKSLGLAGNMSGDKSQLGGCLVVEKGGGDKPLLHYVQQGAPDHVDNYAVLKVMFIEINIYPFTCYM